MLMVIFENEHPSWPPTSLIVHVVIEIEVKEPLAKLR